MYRILLLMLTTLAALPAASQEGATFIVIHPVKVAVLGKGTVLTLLPTTPVRLVHDGDSEAVVELWTSPANSGDVMRVPKSGLADLSSFKPLTAWHGEKRRDVGGGDYDATFSFGSDGTVRLAQTEVVEDKTPAGFHYGEGRYVGRLYKAGEVIWPRFKNVKPSEFGHEANHMMWLLPTGKVCFPSYGDCE